jgi:hypothetical protein
MAKQTSGETFAFADNTGPTKQPQEPSPAQKMLDWLQRWTKTTVNSKEIYQYAPRAVRFNKEHAIKTAEVLEKHGWLVRNKPYRRGGREWQIIRRPIVHPLVEG